MKAIDCKFFFSFLCRERESIGKLYRSEYAQHNFFLSKNTVNGGKIVLIQSIRNDQLRQDTIRPLTDSKLGQSFLFAGQDLVSGKGGS